jgi:hypothetical protein
MGQKAHSRCRIRRSSKGLSGSGGRERAGATCRLWRAAPRRLVGSDSARCSRRSRRTVRTAHLASSHCTSSMPQKACSKPPPRETRSSSSVAATGRSRCPSDGCCSRRSRRVARSRSVGSRRASRRLDSTAKAHLKHWLDFEPYGHAYFRTVPNIRPPAEADNAAAAKPRENTRCPMPLRVRLR